MQFMNDRVNTKMKKLYFLLRIYINIFTECHINITIIKQAVKDVHLYMFVALAWALDIIIMLSWQIADPLEVSLVNVDTEVKLCITCRI